MEKNKIFNEDIFVFLKKIKNNSVDLIVADPPYNINIAEWDKFKSETEYWKFMKKWLDQSVKKLKDGGSIYIFNNQKNSAKTISYLEKKIQFNNWITWYKKDGFSPSKNKYVSNQETILFFSKGKPLTFNFDDIRTPYLSTKRMKYAEKNGILKNGKRYFPNKKGKLCTDVWEFSSERHNKKINGKTIKLSHPTCKPKKIIERIITASSKEGDFVLDLFSGSGITSAVCKEKNRKSFGCEMDKKYCSIISKNHCIPIE